MRLARQEIAVVGAGIGGLAAATALAPARRARPGLRAGVGARRGRRRPPGRAERRRGARGARPPRRRRGAARACREAVELVDFRRGRPVARVPLGQAIVARLRAALLASPPRRPARRPRAPAPTEAGVALSTSATRSRRCSRTATGCGVRTAAGGGGALRPRRRRGRRALGAAGRAPRSGAAALHPATSPGAALVPADRAPGGLSPAGGAGDDGPGPAPRHLSRCAAGRWSTSSRSRSATPGPRRAGRCAMTRPTCAAPSPTGAGRPRALLDAVDDCWLWGLFDHAPLRALGRRPPGAARGRLPPDAALPRPGRDDGARGRLGSCRLPRPRRRSAVGLGRLRGGPAGRARRASSAPRRARAALSSRAGAARCRSRRRSASRPRSHRRCSPARFDWLFGHDVTIDGLTATGLLRRSASDAQGMGGGWPRCSSRDSSRPSCRSS